MYQIFCYSDFFVSLFFSLSLHECLSMTSLPVSYATQSTPNRASLVHRGHMNLFPIHLLFTLLSKQKTNSKFLHLSRLRVKLLFACPFFLVIPFWERRICHIIVFLVFFFLLLFLQFNTKSYGNTLVFHF